MPVVVILSVNLIFFWNTYISPLVLFHYNFVTGSQFTFLNHPCLLLLATAISTGMELWLSVLPKEQSKEKKVHNMWRRSFG